ncbi:MAG TPA: DoxX family protein [Ignavibacteriaceae bacterium]|nr:DoxX family protein [Ignavibacteriaceae bacterium]
MRYIALLGRILFSFIFLETIINHFKPAGAAYAASHGVPFASVVVPLSGIIAFLGALSVILGYKAKAGAWLIVLFLIPVTYFMHQFWAAADPMAAQMEYSNFLKNLSMLGGALIISYFGAGPLSLDAMQYRKVKHERSSERISSYPAVGSEPAEKIKQPKNKNFAP